MDSSPMDTKEEGEAVAGGFATRHNLNRVTTVSKYLALALFVALPFIGGYIGYIYAPEKTQVVKKIVESTEVHSADSGLSESVMDYSKYSFEIIQLPSNQTELGASELVLSDVPSTEINLSDGNQLVPLYTFQGSCNIKQNTDIAGREEILADFIADSSQVLSAVTCWYAGGGYELYMFTRLDGVQVVGFTVDELWPEDRAEHMSPFGKVEILYP